MFNCKDWKVLFWRGLTTRSIYVFYATKLYQDWTMPKDISDLSIRKKKVLGLATFVVKLIRIT